MIPGKAVLKFFIYLMTVSSQNTSECKTRVDPLVLTELGLVRGLRATDGDYSMFLGVPYAKVDPKNPFGPSLPYPKFNNEFQAFDDTVKCPQMESSGAIVGTLDCLHLNIYVPNSASSRNPLPVMVWIYGGNFERGSAGRHNYGPKFLVRHDVILVTVNHRVGLYGYMCLDIPEVPGNQGLKDQVRALRWINQNIAAFGGDVNKVTLFGESSGARSVDFHLISPQEKLFNNVILQSGTSLTRDTIFEPDLEAPIKIAWRLGFPVNSLSAALEYLSTVEPHWAVAAAEDLKLIIKPCVEKEFANVERFITDYTINLNIPKARNIPVLIGYNSDEQIARYAMRDEEYFSNLNIIYDRLYDYFAFEEDQLNLMEGIIRRFYLGDERYSKYMLQKISSFDTIFSYAHPTERTIDMYLNNRADNIFYYVFSYDGGRNYFKISNNVTIAGTSHADELGYLFDMQNFLKDDPTPGDQFIIDRLTTLWTNFAKYGNPTPVTTELLPVKWEPVTKNTKFYLNIGEDIHLDKRPFHDQTAFWDLFYKTNWEFQKGYRKQVSRVWPQTIIYKNICL